MSIIISGLSCFAAPMSEDYITLSKKRINHVKNLLYRVLALLFEIERKSDIAKKNKIHIENEFTLESEPTDFTFAA